ncbi:hypothetical protein C900_03355 [Fulvivirga imtechensis AK7]|uniref:Uncharacterized protein n=1 Tax=Fulvivirga imtechensis AK7 TaxID=1237149 RepID=L8JTY5_9BACT|nr:hypothetical protein C900_03355 [Fulvivirga imtechensis AK7]
MTGAGASSSLHAHSKQQMVNSVTGFIMASNVGGKYNFK